MFDKNNDGFIDLVELRKVVFFVKKDFEACCQQEYNKYYLMIVAMSLHLFVALC